MEKRTVSKDISSFTFGVLGIATILVVFGFMVVCGNYHIDEGVLAQKLREVDPDIGFITDTERHILRKTIVSAIATNGERLMYTVDSNFHHNYLISEGQ